MIICSVIFYQQFEESSLTQIYSGTFHETFEPKLQLLKVKIVLSQSRLVAFTVIQDLKP